MPCGMWNLPGAGIEPVSPVLAGRFRNVICKGYLIDSRKTLIFIIEQVSLQWKVWSAHNADTQCSQGEKRPKGREDFFA